MERLKLGLNENSGKDSNVHLFQTHEKSQYTQVLTKLSQNSLSSHDLSHVSHVARKTVEHQETIVEFIVL